MMQHIRDIATEQSKRDALWSAARTIADCNAYMAIEAQRMGAIGRAHVEKNGWRGASWVRGAMAQVEGHYRYAREMMNITEQDQLYA